jgi:hypothetical protein
MGGGIATQKKKSAGEATPPFSAQHYFGGMENEG